MPVVRYGGWCARGVALLGLILAGSLITAVPVLVALRPAAGELRPGGQVPTRVVVMVIANGGKFVGDDIGGSLVSIRDVHTGELLASGRTQGGAGLPNLPTIEVTRLQEIPEEDAARFVATLPLDEPRLVEITAVGPLAAQAATARASTTMWLLPGATAGDANRAVLTLRGLMVQVLSPPTHFLPTTPAPLPVALRANVTMMCGCPISPTTPWHPEEYQVQATIQDPTGGRHVVPLTFDTNSPDHAPSQFVGTWTASTAGIYDVVVTAHQPVHDNTGSDHVTFIVP